MTMDYYNLASNAMSKEKTRCAKGRKKMEKKRR